MSVSGSPSAPTPALPSTPHPLAGRQAAPSPAVPLAAADPGESEERAGKGLAAARAAGVDTTPVRMHTKSAHGGVQHRTIDDDYVDFTEADARSSYEQSRQQFGDSLFAMRIHDANHARNDGKGLAADGPVDDVTMALSDVGMVGGGLVGLRAEGKISEISMGMMTGGRDGPHESLPDALRLFREAAPGTFDSALLACGWNLLTQDSLPAFVECEQRDVKVHNAGILASGLLAGGVTYVYGDATDAQRAGAAQWGELAARYSLSLPAVAVAFGASLAQLCSSQASS